MELVKGRNVFVGLAALLAVIVFGSSWYTAAMFDPTWVFGTNYLSDLGVSGFDTAAGMFNIGCIVAGALFAILGILFLTGSKKLLYRVAGILTVVAGVSMALIGVFVEGDDLHVPLALTAFGVGFLTLIVLAVADWKAGLRTLASITPVALLILAFSYVLLEMDLVEVDIFFKGIEGVETIAALLLLLLFTLQGMKFLYNGALSKRSADGKGISDRHRLAYGFALLVGATAFLLFWLLSAITAGSAWTFDEDFVYKLGLMSGITGLFFIIGCIAGGEFIALYGIGSGMMRRGGVRSAAGFFIALLGIALILEGITLYAGVEMSEFTEGIIVGIGTCALACLTVSDWQKKKMVTAAFYLIILLCGLTALIFYGYAIATTLSMIAFFVVLELEGVRMVSS